jgi:phosphoglycolate phosphatase-like HAD superfamily hydrolase
MQLWVFTDFDGPIIDVSERYYQVYQHVLREAAQSSDLLPFDKKTFWDYKRAKVPEKEIGIRSGLNPEQAKEFARLRKKLVHAIEYFPLDEIHPTAIAALERLQAAGVMLGVVTMRLVRELEPALAKFDLERFFEVEHRYCISNDHVKDDDIRDKAMLLTRAHKAFKKATVDEDAQCYMVGDTEADILAGQRLGIPSLAVLSGIRNQHHLDKLAPWKVVQNLHEAVQVILDG